MGKKYVDELSEVRADFIAEALSDKVIKDQSRAIDKREQLKK